MNLSLRVDLPIRRDRVILILAELIFIFIFKYFQIFENQILNVLQVWNASKPNLDDSDQPNHEIDVLSGHENDVNYVQFRLVCV